GSGYTAATPTMTTKAACSARGDGRTPATSPATAPPRRTQIWARRTPRTSRSHPEGRSRSAILRRDERAHHGSVAPRRPPSWRLDRGLAGLDLRDLHLEPLGGDGDGFAVMPDFQRFARDDVVRRVVAVDLDLEPGAEIHQPEGDPLELRRQARGERQLPAVVAQSAEPGHGCQPRPGQ